MGGFFENVTNKQPAGTRAVVHWHSSENMSEVNNSSVTLLIGASVYLGKGVEWKHYESLYHTVYNSEGKRILKDNGWFVVIQTDMYTNGGVFLRNAYLPIMLLNSGWRLVDVKIWKRKEADFFQPPYSQVFVFTKNSSRLTRMFINKRSRQYFSGVWDYKQTPDGNNSYPEGLCRVLIEAFTQPGDLVVDPFAGTAKILGVAARMGRRAVGYEIDPEMKQTIDSNL